MGRVIGPLAWLALLATTVSPDGAAQAPGMPVQFAPAARPGLRLGAEVRPGEGVDAQALLGHTYFSLRGSIGARTDGRDGWSTSAVLHLVRGSVPTYLASLEGGYGEGRSGPEDGRVDLRELVVGLAIAPNPVGPLSAVAPWIAPRLHRRWSAPLGEATETGATGYGVSAGVDLRLAAILRRPDRLGGPSLYGAVDYLSLPGLGAPRVSEWKASFGASFTFSFTSVLPKGILRGR